MTGENQIGALVDAGKGGDARIDLLVCNAALSFSGGIHDISLDDWRRIVDVNLFDYLLCVREVSRVMIANNGGAIGLTGQMHSLTMLDKAGAAAVRVTGSTTPRPEAVAAYNTHYALYRRLYPALRTLMHDLSRSEKESQIWNQEKHPTPRATTSPA